MSVLLLSVERAGRRRPSRFASLACGPTPSTFATIGGCRKEVRHGE